MFVSMVIICAVNKNSSVDKIKIYTLISHCILAGNGQVIARIPNSY
jgi:hypothetical protein